MSRNNMPEDNNMIKIMQDLTDRVERLERALSATKVTGIPTGGTTGQSLTKTSNTDYAVGWA